MTVGGLGVLWTVVRDSLQSIFRPLRFRRPAVPLIEGTPENGVAVYVMMPLDATQPSCPLEIRGALKKMADAGVKGIMVDVWWGLCEPRPGVYDFENYRTLVELCKDLGLLVQATMSFHACGGNVGDTVNVPLPDWVLRAGDHHDLWYVDRQGHKDRECLNLSADSMCVLPCTEPKGMSEKAQGESIKCAEGATAQTSNVVNGNAAPGDASCADVAATAPKGGLDGASRGSDLKPDASDEATNAQAPNAVDGTPSPGKASYAKVAATLPEQAAGMNSGGSHGNSGTLSSFSKRSGGSRAPLRTAVQAYQQFMEAFLDAMGPALVGSTIVELQVGCGPCGELRYPSYPLADGMWSFPGMGEFQCFDSHMLRGLAAAAAAAGHPSEWGQIPDATGSYNAKPWSSEFFTRGFKTPRGRFFMSWYAGLLVNHGRKMLEAAVAAKANKCGLALAVKISGIHWWKFTASRAAEATAGYFISKDYNSYEKIAALFREFDTVLDFTCLEMRTIDQPFMKARSGPYQLVREVFRIARKAGVRVAGENALERYDWLAYTQIMNASKCIPLQQVHGFTMLRLGKTLVEDEHLPTFTRFVEKMRRIQA